MKIIQKIIFLAFFFFSCSTLAQALGMLSQEVFAKRDKNGAKKNTHLVCKGAEGTKYEAAINWKIPVVNNEWLLKCLEYKVWVSEEPFWVGKASVSTPGIFLLDLVEGKP